MLAVSCSVSSSQAISQTAPLDNPTAKQKLLAYLKQIGEGPTILSGQNVGHADGDRGDTDIRNIRDRTGKLPAVLGIDLGYDNVGRVPDAAIGYAVDYWNNGGLITLSMTPDNPFTGGNAWDVRTGSLDEMLTPGTEPNRAWMEILNNVANVLDEFKKDGVIVLWRPLHEMNGGWFWWGGVRRGNKWTPAPEYKRLWTHMHNYFTKTRGLDNLLWVYTPNCREYEESSKPVLHYYPGVAYVDIVGLDCYTDDINVIGHFGGYTDLMSLGKPLVLSEFGSRKGSDGSFDSRTSLAIKRAYLLRLFNLCSSLL